MRLYLYVALGTILQDETPPDEPFVVRSLRHRPADVRVGSKEWDHARGASRASSAAEDIEAESRGRDASFLMSASGFDHGANVTSAPEPSSRSFRFDTILTAGSGFLLYSLAAITGPLLARNLGPAGRGDLAAVLAPTQMIGWLLSFGLPWAAAYYVRDHHPRHLIMGSWAFSLVIGGVVAVAGWWVAPLYLSGHNPQIIPWFRAFLFANIVFVPVLTALDLLMARGALVAYNFWRAFAPALNAVLLTALALAGHLTLGSALFASFASNAIWFVGLLSTTRSWPGRGFRRVVVTLQLRYGARVALGNIGGLLVSRLDQVLLVSIVSPSALGYYAVAATAVSFSAPVAEGLATALFPRLRHSDDEAARAQALSSAVRWNLVASIITSINVAAFAPLALPLLFGSPFRASIAPVWIMLPGQVANNAASVLGSKLLADGRPGLVSLGLLVASAVTVIGLSLTVGRWGILAAAWVTTVSQFAYWAFIALVLRHARFHGRSTIGATV